jgi:hypothetical protein
VAAPCIKRPTHDYEPTTRRSTSVRIAYTFKTLTDDERRAMTGKEHCEGDGGRVMTEPPSRTQDDQRAGRQRHDLRNEPDPILLKSK